MRIASIVALLAIAACSPGLGSAPSPSPLTQEQVVALVQPSVVTIKVKVFRGGTVEGSGFVFGGEQNFLTNAHLLAKASTITLTDYLGTANSPVLLGVDRTTDVAELRGFLAPGKPLKAAKTPVKIGLQVLVMGSPATHGIVTGLGQDLTGQPTYHDLIQTDALTNPSSSGAPMVDMSGNLIGMVLVANGRAAAIPVADFATQAPIWALNPPMTVGPPLVTAAASTLLLAKSALPPDFHQAFRKVWGANGYTVEYSKPETNYVGGENLDSDVQVEQSEGAAQKDYEFYVGSDADKNKFKRLGSVSGLGDEARSFRKNQATSSPTSSSGEIAT